MEKLFEQRLEEYSALEKQKKTQFNRVGNIRLLVFLSGAGISGFLFIKHQSLFGYLSLVLFACAFVYWIIRHHHIEVEWKRTACLAAINQQYLDRLKGTWTNFKDTGAEFVSAEHPYTGDLDIFGPKSLFQWLNIANTPHGRMSLAELLESPNKDMAAIRTRQKSVQELCTKLDFCQTLQCEGMLAKNGLPDPENLIAYAENSEKRMSKAWQIWGVSLLPAATWLSVGWTIIGLPIPTIIPTVLLIFQVLVCAWGFFWATPVLATVYTFKKSLKSYNNLIHCIEKEAWEDATLLQYQQQLSAKDQSASSAVKSLERIADAIDLRYSSALYFLLNLTLLWDFHCILALENWKRQYGQDIRKWLQILGQFEALGSLSVTRLLHPDWTFPVLHEKGPQFSSAALGHPLIPLNACVCNDVDLNERAGIVTGSNMSGKTTLLRTIGINLVLAYAGAPVFAQSMDCSILNIHTSMRINDDLSSGISTFYAELLRIKTIIDDAKAESPMIYLIDEIFRGTNSKDRILGAKSVLRNLNRNWIIGLISTHDFELCDLEQEAGMHIRNYHFTEAYSQNQISFDYKLHPGRCLTTNAKYLMKMVGIELSEEV